MSGIHLKSVRSSNIAAIGYDPTSKTLAVQFRNGGTYHYHDVSEDDHSKFMAAPSHGAHHQSHIVGRFKHSKQS